MTDKETIVLDNGSRILRAGFAGEEDPRCAFPSIVGQLRYSFNSIQKDRKKDVYIGEEALKNSDKFQINYPIEHGIITNWDEMEKVWHYTFYDQLHVDPSEHPILITEHSKNPKSNREKMIQIMFETFNVPSFCAYRSTILSLYASGRSTGVVCDIGDGVSEVLPIYEGYGFPHAIIRENLGGRELTDWLGVILTESGNTFTTSSEMEIVRDIKEKHSYVALDYDSELQRSKSTRECDVNYTLPDGKKIMISDVRFRCPELLFKPHMLGFQSDGIDKIIFDSIMKCDINARKDLYANIVLSGGTTMIEFFPERIEKEITNLAPPTMKVKVVAPPERQFYTWVGGSILASLSAFPKILISHDDYNVAGPMILHRYYI